MCILDEYGYYAVEGFAVVPAQARSLGFSVVFAGQDLPAFQKASKEEAASIGANTNIKICMKLEDPTETWDFFMKTAGESYVTHVDSFQVDQGSVLGTYADAKGARLEKRARVDLLDLKEQTEGEAHFFFRSKVVRGRFFYANPKPVKRMHLNHFLMVDAPTDAAVEQLEKTFATYHALVDLSHSGWEMKNTGASEEIDRIAHLMQENQKISPILNAMRALLHFEEKIETNDIPASFFEEVSQSTFVEPELPEGKLNIFLPLRMNPHLEKLAVTNDPKFKEAILNRTAIRNQIEILQRLSGQSGKQAISIASELIGDMEKGTNYPPTTELLTSPKEVVQHVRDMVKNISLKKKEAVERK
ncbi:MAG: hypothetical protein ACD_29C00211G0001 [uncultured bacterium]|nr:MAG: hypothetical protein ACD_29C00211G0001 [uncultured bacterium]